MNKLTYITIFSLILFSCSESKIDSIDNPSILYIDNHLVDCVGVGPQKCMLIKNSLTSDWTYFYDTIYGFNYEEGYSYKLNVNIETIKNPPADGSSLKYTLIDVLKKSNN